MFAFPDRKPSNIVFMILLVVLFYFVPILSIIFYPEFVFHWDTLYFAFVAVFLGFALCNSIAAFVTFSTSNIRLILGQVVPFIIDFVLLYAASGFTSFGYSLNVQGFELIAMGFFAYAAFTTTSARSPIAVLYALIGLFFVREGYLSASHLVSFSGHFLSANVSYFLSYIPLFFAQLPFFLRVGSEVRAEEDAKK